MKNFKLGIALPISWTHVPVGFMASLVQMQKPNNYVLLISGQGSIDQMRNQLVQAAKDQECTHLLFLDTDHNHHQDTIKKLVCHCLPIVGGLSFMRSEPYEPVMLRGKINSFKTVLEWNKDELVPVDATGAASLLIDMEVFKKIEKPYFQFLNNPDPNIPYRIGEDVSFCLKAREAGYNIFVDTSCTNQHFGVVNVDESFYKKWNTGECSI